MHCSFCLVCYVSGNDPSILSLKSKPTSHLKSENFYFPYSLLSRLRLISIGWNRLKLWSQPKQFMKLCYLAFFFFFFSNYEEFASFHISPELIILLTVGNHYLIVWTGKGFGLVLTLLVFLGSLLILKR